ncbi:MAG: hypothetical protein GF398_11080 [Chitinivibrionales bacterium]|nr:hypothetical protein [Chitinivibrionales bacterium]
MPEKAANPQFSTQPGALDVLGAAFKIVTSLPAVLYLRYYLGTLPFVFAFLYFWSDMSKSAFAADHIHEASLGLALAFFWMKWWQVRFATGVYYLVSGIPEIERAHKSGAHFAVVMLVHALQFVALPLGLISGILFGWVYAFFQSANVNSGEQRSFADAVKLNIWRAGQCSGQNHIVLSILVLIIVIIFINLFALAGFLPTILKNTLNIDSPFTLYSGTLINSTFMATLASLAYIVVDPLIKIVYVLRCHYTESRTSGDDIIAAAQRQARVLIDSSGGHR